MKKILSFVLTMLIALSLTACGGGEKINWDDIVLGSMLPKPPASKGEIHYNSADELWIDINDLSAKQYADYVEACKEMGFTVDAESDSSTYNAYNADGYKLKLSHYGSDADMSIELEKPMEMTTISWPTSIAGKMLPVPESTKGSFSYESDNNFLVYIGDTSKADYDAYVATCSEEGFNVDYDKGKDYYYADNSEGWSISLRYEGNNIMSISIYPPSEDDNTTEPTAPATEESKPDVTETEPEKENTNNGGLDPDFKAAMDSYEKFMDEYIAFMKKYSKNPSDLSLLADYADYLNKYSDFVENFEKWEDQEMNAAETAYYIEVQSRVSKKLLEVAY